MNRMVRKRVETKVTLRQDKDGRSVREKMTNFSHRASTRANMSSQDGMECSNLK